MGSSKKIRIGIDASNIRAGGGITHLREILSAVDLASSPIVEVHVWGGKETLQELPDRPWLQKHHEPWLDRQLSLRSLWQLTVLQRRARTSCDLLFIPGGTYLGTFKPYVTISRNFLPFDPIERARFPEWGLRLRYRLLRALQGWTFRNAQGVIFLTPSAKERIASQIGPIAGATAVVPHGVSDQFREISVSQFPLSYYSYERPFRWVYVSIVNWYKHQWQVAKAVAALRRRGLPVALDLVGSLDRSGPVCRLKDTISILDPAGEYIRLIGNVPHQDLPNVLRDTDGYVFASTCENLPNILLEGMAAGLPIACSDRAPMPEILGDGGRYFNPEDANQIEACLNGIMLDFDWRKKATETVRERSSMYTWKKSADRTFRFLAQLAGP